MRRFAIVIYLAIVFAPNWTYGAAKAYQEFERFISAPPIISNMVVEKKIWNGRKPFDGSFSNSVAFEYYQVRLQSGAMFLRKVRSCNEITNDSVAVTILSTFDHKITLFDGTPYFYVWYDTDATSSGKQFSIFNTRSLLLEPLREALNLAVLHVEQGTIRWEHERFSCTAQFGRESLVVSGELFTNADGAADHLKVEYDGGQKKSCYIIRYGYFPPLQYAFLPTTMTNFFLSGGKEIDVGEMRILEVETNRQPLQASLFDGTRFQRLYNLQTRVYTNGSYYSQSASGVLAFLRCYEETTRGLSGGLANHRERMLACLFTAWIAINCAFFALYLRAKGRYGARVKQTHHQNDIYETHTKA